MDEIMSILTESLDVQKFDTTILNKRQKMNIYSLEIQYEAAWALMNIIANKKSEQIQALFTPKVIIALIKLFDSTSDVSVANQVLLAIGNVIAENPGLCYQCIYLGVIPSLVKQMMNFLANEEFIRTLSWVMANICHVKDQPTFSETGYDLLPISYQIVTKKDSETVANSIWALTYLTDDGLDVLMNFEKSVIRDIVPHLTSSNIELKSASLHLLANIACGNDELTNSIIKYGTLKHLGKFLTGSNKEFKREAAWMLSNILAGTKKQIDAVFKAGLVQPLIELLNSDMEKIQEKAVWAITNIPLCGAKHHVFQLLDMDIIPPFCQCLNASRPYIVESTLEGIKMILEQCHERKKEVCRKLIECGAVENIKRHEKEGNKRAQEHTRKIISEYFTN
uniref:Importin subunit alpha n=1 Tax=Panagrolaimus davidi TaxID=227884 RepID=A0A914PX85_9BILA